MPFPGDPLAAPKLNGVLGRPIADSSDYRYSEAFMAKKAEGFMWTEQNLRDYLRNPRGFIPGSIMVFAGLKRSSHRDDVVAYLKSCRSRTIDLNQGRSPMHGHDRMIHCRETVTCA